MNSEEYERICRICFEPIKIGQGIEFKESQNFYHKKCTEENPDSYYFSLDRIIKESNEGKNTTDLMDEMERIFKIPILNDPTFNEEHPKVIALYR